MLHSTLLKCELLVVSRFLALPKDLTEILLDYIASEPMAILNLRKVCSVTKGWVDAMRPSQAKRIFSSIPIILELYASDLEKFEQCPPPPSASALKLIGSGGFLKTPGASENLRISFPRFLDFWSNKMTSLQIDHYSFELLNVVGHPNKLQNLISDKETLETHPSVLQF